MEGKDRAILKDEILYQLDLVVISSTDNLRLVLDGKYSFFNFENVVDELIDSKYIETVTLTKSGHSLKITHRGIKVLEEGGFLKDYEAHTARIKSEMEAALVDGELKKLQSKELKQKIRNNRYALPLSIASILIALGSFGLSFYNPPANDSKVEFQKMEQLQKDVKQLEKGLQQENYLLKEDLNKAEMLISIYESEK